MLYHTYPQECQMNRMQDPIMLLLLLTSYKCIQNHDARKLSERLASNLSNVNLIPYTVDSYFVQPQLLKV